MTVTLIGESLTAEIKGLSDTDLIDTLRDAVRQRAERVILDALLAEMKTRSLKL